MGTDNLFGLETLHICFIKSSFEIVQVELGSIINETLTKNWHKGSYLIQEENINDFFSSNNHTDRVKCLLWESKSINFEMVVFLTNMPDGWLTLLNLYFKRYKHEIIRIALSDSGNKFPFYLYEQIQEDNHRIIQVLKEDSEWKFFQRGSLLPFENSIFYKKRRIADRLNNGIIKQYLRKNKIDIDNLNFWRSNDNCIMYWINIGDKTTI